MAAQNLFLDSKATIQEINFEMMRLYFDEGWPPERIATHFNRALATVHAMIRQQEVTNPDRCRSIPKESIQPDTAAPGVRLEP